MKRLQMKATRYLLLTFYLMLLMMTGSVIFSGAALGQTANQAVQLKDGWFYAKGEVLPEQAGQTGWTAIRDFTEVDQPVETRSRSLVSFKIELPDLKCTNCAISLRHYVRQFDLYLGNERIYRSQGGSEWIKVPNERPPLLIGIPYHANNRQLIVVTNHYHRSQLIGQPVYFGEAERIIHLHWDNDRTPIFLGVLILIIGLISFMLYLSLSRDKMFLMFGFCAFMLGIYQFSTTNLILYLFDYPSFWEYCEYLLIYLMPVYTWLYFRNFMIENRIVDALIIGSNLMFSAYAIFTLSAGTPIYDWADEQRYLFLVYLIIVLTQLLRSAYRGNRDARQVLIIFVLLFTVTFANVLIKIVYPVPYDLNPASGAFFMISQLFILTYRFKRMNQELEARSKDLSQMNTKLREMNDIKDSIIANTSHELRTPLNGIIGMAEGLIDITDVRRKETREGLQMIAVSGRRLQSLVDQILDFSMLRGREMALNLQPVDIHPIIREITEQCKPSIGSKPIQIGMMFDEKVQPVMADPERMRQILFQLLDNAIKFTEQGTIIISTAVHHHQLMIQIRDTGIGMSEELMHRMFNLFEQGDMSANRKYGGTGLGLALVKELTELHEGSITCESEPGKGTIMTLTFPLGGQI